MQEEIEQKSFNIMISTTKLSARTVLRAVKAAFRLYQSKTSQGKQSVRTLLRQNRGVSSVEISKTGIRGLERYAKKYGIDYDVNMLIICLIYLKYATCFDYMLVICPACSSLSA